MTDEQQRCREAGMDDLLTKPLELHRLRAVLERLGLGGREPRSDEPNRQTAARPAASGSAVGGAAASGAAAGRTAPGHTADAPVDLMRLSQTLGSDPHFLGELTRTFVASSAAAIDALSAALAAGDREQLRALAHRLKGAGQSVYADRIVRLAMTLEHTAREAPLSDLTARISEIRTAVEEARRHVQEKVA